MGGEVEAPSDGAVPRAPRRCALLLRPDHRHWHAARGVLCEGNDGFRPGRSGSSTIRDLPNRCGIGCATAPPSWPVPPA